MRDSGIYDAKLDILSDNPPGTIIATITQLLIFYGYETSGIFVSIYNNKLYLGSLQPEWDMMVNILVLYLKYLIQWRFLSTG